MVEDFVMGKGKRSLTAIEYDDNKIYLFKNGKEFETVPYQRIIYTTVKGSNSEVLSGQGYKYRNRYEDHDYLNARKAVYARRINFFDTPPDESYMLESGETIYKNMRFEQVSALSFDIESNGLMQENLLTPVSKNPEVYLISTAFKKDGKVTKKLFSVDEYFDQKEMIEDFCKYVRKCDPDILLGHNIFSYDLPYLTHIAGPLKLGRLDRELDRSDRLSKKRKDGSQAYEYYNYKCFGRSIIDTMFLAITFDIKREFISYGLKKIVSQLGFEKDDRQHYDASKISKNWNNRTEREKIKKYAMDDAEDALNLFNYMAPNFFYFTQYIPMSFQSIINSATGRQINLYLCRAYLQQNKAIPIASEKEEFQGAISHGVPGLYKNVFKIDVKSQYPSIMRKFKVFDPVKDPDGIFLKTVDYFTEQRFANKAKYEETGDKYYDNMQEAGKIFINSCYGLLGATGLNFNFPAGARFVTAKGRAVIRKAIQWATGNDITAYIDYSSNEDVTLEQELFDKKSDDW